MRAAVVRVRAALSVPMLCLCAVLLSGCSLWNTMFHRSHDNACREKPFQGNTENLPPLKVPAGLSAPDTRNGVKIPALNTTERVRAKTEPCLAQPPSYATGTSIAVPVRSGTPMGAPAPQPLPAPPAPPVPSLPEPEPSTPSIPAPSTPSPPPP